MESLGPVMNGGVLTPALYSSLVEKSAANSGRHYVIFSTCALFRGLSLFLLSFVKEYLASHFWVLGFYGVEQTGRQAGAGLHWAALHCMAWVLPCRRVGASVLWGSTKQRRLDEWGHVAV